MTWQRTVMAETDSTELTVERNTRFNSWHGRPAIGAWQNKTEIAPEPLIQSLHPKTTFQKRAIKLALAFFQLHRVACPHVNREHTSAIQPSTYWPGVLIAPGVRLAVTKHIVRRAAGDRIARTLLSFPNIRSRMSRKVCIPCHCTV